MTSRHPIVPSLELVHQWDEEGRKMFRPEYQIYLTTRAAQWGADQELEECCAWLEIATYGDTLGTYSTSEIAKDLRAGRRPKSPSLKEQALALIEDCTDPEGDYLDDNALSIIRRALEALPE